MRITLAAAQVSRPVERFTHCRAPHVPAEYGAVLDPRYEPALQLMPGDTNTIFVLSSKPWPGHFIDAGPSPPKPAP